MHDTVSLRDQIQHEALHLQPAAVLDVRVQGSLPGGATYNRWMVYSALYTGSVGANIFS